MSMFDDIFQKWVARKYRITYALLCLYIYILYRHVLFMNAYDLPRELVYTGSASLVTAESCRL